MKKGLKSPSSVTQPLYRQLNNSVYDTGSTDCTKIEIEQELVNVLKDVKGVSYDKMCRDLDITQTCNNAEGKDVFILLRLYMEQHPEPC